MEAKSEIDLSGKLIIKVQLGDDIRRIPIHNEAITYDELVLMMQRVFRGKLTANDDITLKYKDEDGDLITIFDSSDLSFAIQCSRILKLQVIFKADLKNEFECGITRNDVQNIKLQLRTIRDQVNKLLDTLDKNNSSETVLTSGQIESGESSTTDLKSSNTTLNKVNSSEFDPLKEKNQKNGNEEVKEPPKPSSISQQVNNEAQNNRPQSVSMATTVVGQPQPVVVSSAGHNNPHMSDYFNRTSTASTYPQMQYSSMQYPHQYNYPTGYVHQAVMDNSQVPNSTAYANPQAGNVAYPQQQYNQQPMPGSGVFSGGAPGNPYSAKTFTQPNQQHGYIPPRQ